MKVCSECQTLLRHLKKLTKLKAKVVAEGSVNIFDHFADICKSIDSRNLMLDLVKHAPMYIAEKSEVIPLLLFEAK